jgi:uncharacterized protein YbcI
MRVPSPPLKQSVREGLGRGAEPIDFVFLKNWTVVDVTTIVSRA